MRKSESSLQRLFNVVDALVDDRVGIINRVMELPKEAGGPDFFHFYGQACNTKAFCRQRNFGVTGGASTDRGTAMAKAIGEAVERYCSALYDADEFPLISFKSAPFPCVPPGDFALYSRTQYAQEGFPYVPFEDFTIIRWVPGQDLLTRETRYVPAAMGFLPYFCAKAKGDQPIVQPISTGLACHCSPEEASISAICEVIERDAFTITWQAALGRAQIRIDTLSESNCDRIERFERTGGSVTILNLTMDHGVPTVLSVLRYHAPDAPALTFAAAAHLDPEQAVRNSLDELAHTRRFAQSVKSEQPAIVTDPNFEQVVDQDSHVNLYCDHLNTSMAEFIYASPDRIDFQEMGNHATGDIAGDLKILGERLCAINHRVFLVDLTSDDVRGLGFYVVRAIIPGFHPLFMGHRVRALGGSRLWHTPQKLGYRGITCESEANPAPHPYP